MLDLLLVLHYTNASPMHDTYNVTALSPYFDVHIGASKQVVAWLQDHGASNALVGDVPWVQAQLWCIVKGLHH